MVTELLDAIQQRFSDAFAWILSPLWMWYALFILFVIFCAAVVYFLGWLKFVRVVVGSAVVLAGAFLVGGHVMYRQTRAQLELERARRKELERRNPPARPRIQWPFG